MNSNLNRPKKTLIRRSISLAVVLAMLLNELFVWNGLKEVPIIGSIVNGLSMNVSAAELDDDDTQFVHNADNSIEVDIVDLVSYSANCQIYSTYHQNDRITIVSGKDVSDYFESGFQGIGTQSKPFKGSIEMGANTDATLNLDAPLFNYVYDSVTINNGNLFDISRYYPANATTDKTTPIIAKYVKHDAANSTLRTWNINLVKPSDFNQSTEHNLGEFGGLIGEMLYDSDSDTGAKLSVTVTMNTLGTDTEDIALAGSGDMGLACGHMGEKTELTFAMSGDRGISSISTSGGDVGGLVGEMETGAVLTYNGANFLDSGIGISTSATNSYAGGIAGKNTGATVNLETVDLTAEPIAQYVINQSMTGTAGAGGVYGYYKPAEALVSTTVDEGTVDKSVNTKNYNINCQVNGKGSTGGLFGVLDAEYDVTISGDGTVTANHASGSCTSFGGLIGQYNPNSLERTLTVTNVTAVPSKGGSATYYGGCVGKIDDTVQSYASFNTVTVNASDAGSLAFGGLVASADNAFIDVNVATVTASGFKGGGLVGSLDHGVLRLDGTVNLTGATPAAPGTGEENKIGKVVGWRDDALVFARSTCNLTKSNTAVDDIGSWGQVIRFAAEDSTKSVEKLGGTEVLSVNESTHAVTIAAPSDSTNSYKKIDSVSDYAKTALCFQIDAGNNDFITFADTSYTCSNIGSQNITLTSDVDLSNTGFVNLTRDNNIGTTNAATKCTYAGTAQTPVVFDGKPDGIQYSITYGGSTVYRHSYTGLFGISNNATIQETTFAGTLNVNAKEATMYAGSAVGKAKGKFTASDLVVNTTINHAGDKDLYVGGVLGEAASDIGAITVSDITANATITGGASSTCLGGVIGKISHATNSAELTWSFTNIDITGSITNTASLDKNQVGGLVAVISGNSSTSGNTTNYTINRTLNLNSITVKGLDISVKANSNGSVGGVLGYSWAGVDADFDGIEIGTSANDVITTPTITQTNNSATGVDFAGLVYSGSGYWTLTGANDIKITALKLKSENAQSFGVLVNRGWIGNSDMDAIETALYLELQNANAYTLTADNVAFKKSDDSTAMVIPVFDELVAHTAFYTGTGASKVAYSGSNPDNLYILQNGQGIVSIQTSGDNGGLTMNGTDASGTYTPATTYGQQMNPYARYYYNLNSMKTSITGAAGLMSWGAKWYAHSSIKSDVSSNTSWGSTIPDGTYNMQGYSWYPLNIDSAEVSINGTFTLYNKEFEGSEAAAATANSNHAARTSLYSSGTTQHYLMHSALFNNVGGKLTIGSVTLRGSIPQINTTRTVGGDAVGRKYSGALVLGTLKGSGPTDDATAKITTTSVILDGVYVHNFDVDDADDYAPLLIDRTDDYSTLTIRGVKVNSDASYKDNDAVQQKTISGNTYPKAATSLIGNAGGSNESKNINVSFTNIQLDGRDDVLSLPDLTSAYHTDVSLFTRATLLNRLCFDTGKGVYTYSHSDDWTVTSGEGVSPVTYSHNVTYGKEVGYTTGDSPVNNQYPDQERKYLSDTKYTNPTTSAGTDDYSANFINSYLPYVAVSYDSSNNYYQLEVNHVSATFSGCGTYNDPYIITNGDDFLTIYDILANEVYSSSHKLYLPMSSETAANLSATWHGATGCKEYIFDTTDHVFYLGGDSSKQSLTTEQVRTYVAGAYYKLDPTNSDGTATTTITIPYKEADSEKFKGLGYTNNVFAQFRGVIVGTGIETVVNKSGFPLIAYSNGSVVKDVNIEVDMNTAAEGQPAATGTITKTLVSAKAYDATPSASDNYYGTVMGSVLGGDNIIDGVTVTFKNTSIVLSGDAAQLIPVGGYVGVVLNGGVIFRGMEGKTSGISGIPAGVVTAGSTPGVGNASLGDMTSDTNKRWLYVNPIIGRVINGYAVTEASAYRPFEDGTRVYHGGARTLFNETTGKEYEDPNGLVTKYWDETNQTEVSTRPAALSCVTMRNGKKNYSITDVNPNEANMLDAKTGNAIDVPNGQAFFVMSLIVNSGAGIQKGTNDKTLGTTLGYYTGYYTLRHANYSNVGDKVNNSIITTIPSGGDYDSSASRDNYYAKLSNDNDRKFNYTPYIIEKYTKSYTETISSTSRVIYYAKLLSNNAGNSWTINLLNKMLYSLPDGYKGIGNYYQNNDSSRLKAYRFFGNGATISQNTSYYYYFKKNSNNNGNAVFDSIYTQTNYVGLGLINYQSVDITAEDVYLSGNIVADAIDSSSSTGDHIPYWSKNEGWTAISGNDGIERTSMQSVGAFIGQTAFALSLTDIILDNVYVKGLRNTGGLIGYSTDKKVTIDVYKDCDKIKVHSAGCAGGLIGRKFAGAAAINYNNFHLNLTEVICESVGTSNDSYDANYAVGGLIGGARCDFKSDDNTQKIYVIENINIGDKDKTVPITIKCENSHFFTGGLVGVATRSSLEMDNCHIYNLDLTSAYYAGGLVGQIATVPNTRTGGDANKNYNIETYITNCSIEKNEGSSYGKVVSTGKASGGFIGAGKNDLKKDVILTNCYIKGITLSSQLYTGGVAGVWGYVQNDAPQNDCSCLVLRNFSISGCTLKGDDSVGGLVGVLNEQHQVSGHNNDGTPKVKSDRPQYLIGYNVLAKNLSFGAYSGSGSPDNVGYICGFNEKVIQIAGFSRQDDQKNPTMIADLVGKTGTVAWTRENKVDIETVTENTENIFGERTYNNETSKGYVIFADYNDYANSSVYQNKLFSNVPSTGTNVTTMRSKTTIVVETYENGFLSDTDTIVSYGDYDSTATGEAVISYSEGYEEGVSTEYTKTTTTVENENYPFVTSSRKFDIDGASYLTGDGVSSYSYDASAFLKITTDRENDTNKAYTVFNGLDADAVTKIHNAYSDSFTEFKNYLDVNENSGIQRFPLLIAEDTNRATLTTLINNYLDTLTNTTYNFADTTNSAVYDVGLYKCTYNPGTKVFDVDASSSSTACLKKMSVTLSGQTSYYFYMEASDVDTGDIPQFSLMDVMFKDPSGSGNVAYHLYVPVYVRKVLRYDFNAEIKSGTEYDRAEYLKLTAGLSQNTRSQGLFENIGNPVTIAFEYQYTRSAAEWVAALNAGDSVLTNYYKSLTIKNHNGNNWPTVTKLVLVDANNKDKYYYLDTPPTMNSAQTTYISLYDFTDSNGIRFEPAPLQNLMTVTVTQDNNGTLTPTAGNTSTGATVFDGTTYYRPVTDDDTSLAASAKYTVLSVSDIKPERYYLSIFTKLDTEDEKIYRYEISSPESFNSTGTGVTHTATDWSVADWRANKINNSTKLNLFIGNLYDNRLTLAVVPQKSGSQVMANDNRFLKVTMTANVKLTESAVNAGIPANMSSFQNKAEIYQTFLMMYDKLEADESAEVGISLDADGAVGDISHKYMGGDIRATEFNMDDATAVDHEEHIITEQYVELRNGQNLIKELYKDTNNHAVTIQVDFEMAYAPNYLSLQFPKKEDGSSADVGSCVIGYSKIASTVEGAANSAAQDKKTDSIRYYTSDEATATLEYSVVTSRNVAGQYHYLGINSVETGDDACYIDTYAVYDTRSIKNSGDFIELTLTLSNKSSYVHATVGNPILNGTALRIESYLSELKIYGAGDTVIFEQGATPTSTSTVVTTDGLIYKVRLDKSLLKTQTEGVYYIPIDFKVKTGNTLFNNNNSGLEYANYKVSLTAAMYPAIDSAPNGYSKASYAYDHIIYTNARVVPEVIEP